jgi:hypothetical protein
MIQCLCGTHYDHARWEGLTLIGGHDPDDEPRTVLELRICAKCSREVARRRISSAPTKVSRAAAVRLLDFEAARLRQKRTG